MSDLNMLAAALVEARAEKSDREDALKEANRRVEESERALFDAMVDAELSKISANGYTFSLDMKAYYSVRADSMSEFHEAMEQLGRGGIFKFSVHYQTLNATLRELVDQHDGEMPGDIGEYVDVFDRGKVQVRKAPGAK